MNSIASHYRMSAGEFFVHNFPRALFHARLNYLKSEVCVEEGETEHIKMSCWIIKNTRINFSSHRQHSFILFLCMKATRFHFHLKFLACPSDLFPSLSIIQKISQWTGKLRKKRKSALIINSHICEQTINAINHDTFAH